MPGVMPFSHWLVLPAKTISMRLTSADPTPAEAAAEKPLLNRRTRSNGGRRYFRRNISAGRATKEEVNSPDARLKGQLSAGLRDQLLGELKRVTRLTLPLFGPVVFFQLRTR